MGTNPISSTPIRFEHVGDGVLKRMNDLEPPKHLCAICEQIEYADYEVVIRYRTSMANVAVSVYRPVKTCNPIDAILIGVLSFRHLVNDLNFESIEIVNRPLTK